MPKRILIAVVISALLVGARAASLPQNHFDGKTWWNYVTVLAADDKQGRDTGSEGLRKAEGYVVEQLKTDGAQPAGENGYYQPIQFESRQLVEKDSSLALIRNGKLEPLKLGEDALLSTRVDVAPQVEAPLVFVGYGLRIPEKNYDDLSGLDLKGKVAIVFSGSPADIPTELASHYQSAAERWKALRAAGAIGTIALLNPASMDIPWSRIALNRARPSMSLADPNLNDTAGQQLSVMFNPAQAEKLFAGSGHTFSEIAALGKDRKPLPRFPLPLAIRARAKVEKERVESDNVIAVIPGSDPELKKEYVVLSAHIDHLGIGAPIHGDRIYNGAMDNASGCAVLLDLAASLRRSPVKLRRSLLLLFITGEEKGLLGSKYFAAHPTVDRTSMVADINIDMFLPVVPLKVLTVYGLAESDLGDRVREVAAERGVAIQADPEPLRNIFIRSDQYNFIRHGIPALAMKVGAEPGSPQQKIMKEWLTYRYHAPSDDPNQPVDLSAAASFEEIIRGLSIAVANEDRRPEWKQNSFFRRYTRAAN